MRRAWRFGIAVLGLTFALAGAARVEGAKIIGFRLEDQFDRRYSDADLRGRVVLIVGSDRKGSQYVVSWIRAVRQAVEASGGVEIVEVADLRGVPFFVRGMVKKKFPSDPAKPVLLDWRGTLAEAYSFEKDACSLLLLDAAGQVARQASGTEVEAEVVRELARVIEQLKPRAETRSPRNPVRSSVYPEHSENLKVATRVRHRPSSSTN